MVLHRLAIALSMKLRECCLWMNGIGFKHCVNHTKHVAEIGSLLLLHCITQHDGYPIAETESLKVSTLVNIETSNMRHELSFISILKSVMNFGASSENEHGMSFCPARMVDNVEGVVLSDFQTGNSPKIYH